MVITHVIRVSGRVQGVGFRYAALSLASNYDIKGYVENDRYSKDAIIHCQGDKNTIADYIKKIGTMNGLIRVDHVNIDSEEEDEYDNFIIK
jgi:acylphosphatase